MAYINVYDWKSDQVIEWLKGELKEISYKMRKVT